MSNLKKDRAYWKKDQSKSQKCRIFHDKLNQITKMQNQSRDELEQIAEMRRIKKHKEMSTEELIISLLKSKTSLLNSLTIILIMIKQARSKNIH